MTPFRIYLTTTFLALFALLFKFTGHGIEALVLAWLALIGLAVGIYLESSGSSDT